MAARGTTECRHDFELNDDPDDDPDGPVEICAECGRRRTT
jgi:hypothetical protein